MLKRVISVKEYACLEKTRENDLIKEYTCE